MLLVEMNEGNSADEAAIGLFTILVSGPAILAATKTRLPWIAFFIAWAIGSAAGVVVQNVSPK
jgi:hypothetical protein